MKRWLLLPAILLAGLLLPVTLQAQLVVEGSTEGGFPVHYKITGVSASGVQKGGMFGGNIGISAEQVRFPVTMEVTIGCTTPENSQSTCDQYRLCYNSKFQPGSYRSKTMSDGSNTYSITITESDLVEDTIWGDNLNGAEGKRVRIKKYLGAIYVLPEMYDLSESELQEAINDKVVANREGLAMFASSAVNLDITIPMEVLGEKKKDDEPERVEITVSSYGYDTISKRMKVTGSYRSKTKITSATFFRSLGGAAVQGYISYGDGSFSAECDYAPGVANQFKIVFDNEAKLSAEQTINMNADGSSGKQSTTDESGNTEVDVPPPVIPGLGPTGNLPGPEKIIEGIVGVVAPGLVGVIGGIISGILGGGNVPPPVTPPPGPKGPVKKPEEEGEVEGKDEKKDKDKIEKEKEKDKEKDKDKEDKENKEQKEKEQKEKEQKEKENKEKEQKEKEQKEKEQKEKEQKEKEQKEKEQKEKEEKRKEAREKAKKLLEEKEKADKELGSWTSTFINTVKSAGADIKQGVHDVKEIMGPVIGAIKEETKSAIKDIMIDPKGVIKDTFIGTVKDTGQGIADIGKAGVDIVTHPIDIGWETIKGTAHDTKVILTETYGKAIVEMVKDPKKFVDFVYNASGGEDLIASMDPNRSLVDRSFHYGVAVYKTILNTMGGAGIQQGGLAAVKAAGIRGLTSTVQYGAARNAPVFQEFYKQVEAMSKAGAKHLGVELTTTQKLKITTGLFLEWYKRRHGQ